MGLYTSAHYKNTPNDLQMLSDAPAHSVFVLLSPSAEQDSNSLPDILAVVQVALEGKISRKAVEAQLARGHRSAGDLIPWTISQQFGDSNFAQLSGARIVRVAVHPSVQGMGYGSRAIELLYRFYNGEMVSLSGNDDSDDESNGGGDADKTDSSDDEAMEIEDGRKGGIRGEKLSPRKELPPLLLPLTEVKAPRLDWLGTSVGLTDKLHNFWRRSGMRMLYLRQTKNDLTGEHSSILAKALPRRTGFDDAWLPAFVADSQRRFISLLTGSFRDMDVRLALSILDDFNSGIVPSEDKNANLAIEKRSGSSLDKITVSELNYFLTPHDLKRIELYGRNLCDHHLVTDLLSPMARLYFSGRFASDFRLSSVQSALLCGIGLQSKSVDSLNAELGLPTNQVLAMFNKAIRKMSNELNRIVEEEESATLLGGKARLEAEQKAEKMKNVSHQTLEEDAEEGAKSAMKKLKEQENSLPSSIMKDAEIMKYAVKGNDEQWSKALADTNINGSGMVQIEDMGGKERKRKLNVEDIEKEAERFTPGKKQNKTPKKKFSKKKR